MTPSQREMLTKSIAEVWADQEGGNLALNAALIRKVPDRSHTALDDQTDDELLATYLEWFNDCLYSGYEADQVATALVLGRAFGD